MILRKAKQSELTFIQDFAKTVIDKNYRDSLGDEAVDFFIGSGTSDQYMQEHINGTIVAVMEDQIVGICICKENLIDLFMVQNEVQNLGIGSTFLNMICEELFKEHSQIRLECFEKNVKANRFYVRNGWKQEKSVFDEEIGDNRIYYYKEK